MTEIAERARQLRKNPTEAERKLWSPLRRQQLRGHRFRRQAPIGPYVVDFVCYAARLVVEVDGGQHAAASAADARRSLWLRGQGFEVIRFWNNDVLSNSDGVVARIDDALARRSVEAGPGDA